MLQPETLFDNRYELIRLLGRGGFAEVWLVKDNLTGLEEALKIYAPGGGMDEDGLKIFAQELTVVHDLRHTNLLTPKSLGQYENQPYLILPYCPNGSLNKLVGLCPEDEAWRILEQVAAGLAYLHEQGIVHQDIKPDNILMDTKGNYVITDFGISLRAKTTLRKSMRAQANSGTRAYMAPERFSAEPHPIPANDIWSLGAMMFELVEGDVPFEEDGGGKQKSGADIPTMHADVSDNLKQVIHSLLALNPDNRPTAAKLMSCKKNVNGRITKCPQILPFVDGVKNSSAEQNDKKPGKDNHKWSWMVALFLVILAGVSLYYFNEPTDGNPESLGETAQSDTVKFEPEINKDSIENIICDICRCSSKGGDYYALKDYFTDTISPHPSGEAHYNYNIGELTKDYVGRFPEYEISSPTNFSYSSTTFPVIVKCDINVTWLLENGTRKRAWIHKKFYVDSEYKITGYSDEEYKKETLQKSMFDSGYSIKTDVYYNVIFEVNSLLPVYSSEKCVGNPSFYLNSGSEFVVLNSRKVLYSAQLLTITKVCGKNFPDCLDNNYRVGDKLYVLESINDGANLVLNNKREEYACFSIQGDKAVTRYDGCNMIEGNISGYEKSVVTMHVKTTKGGMGIGYIRLEYDYKAKKSDWDAVTTWWNQYYEE